MLFIIESFRLIFRFFEIANAGELVAAEQLRAETVIASSSISNRLWAAVQRQASENTWR